MPPRLARLPLCARRTRQESCPGHDVDYQDLGGDYFTRRDPQRAMQRIIRQANALGFTVRFDPLPAA